MRPDRAELGPERAFSFAGDDEGLVSGLLGFRARLRRIERSRYGGVSGEVA
jgi:hypothetical protein